MSVENVRIHIEEFLKSKSAEVICIRGNWGTGKTHTWNDVLRKTKPIPIENYAYVSLFGLNSLDGIKQEIFHQKRSIDTLDKGFSADDIKASYENAWSKIKPATSMLTRFLGDGYAGLGISVMAHFIRDTIICIDDLERKGEQLRSADVLGFVSQLKEERNCKVVLLLNDEQLVDRDDFTGLLEKVVDVNLRFAPSPTESAAIALASVKGSEELVDEVRMRVIKLGIDNIRVIRKIVRTVIQIEPLLKEYKPGVLKSVITSLVLLGWCYHQPEVAPPIEFVKSLSQFTPLAEGKQDPQEAMKKKWRTVFREYGYMDTDEFDLVLLDGISNGFFDKDVVAGYANELHLREQSAEANSELEAAWDVFMNSFANEPEALETAMRACFDKNTRFYSLSVMIKTVELLRSIGSHLLAEEIFSRYVDVNKNTPGAFDVNHLYRFGQEVPEDLRKRLATANRLAMPDPTVDQLFLGLSEAGLGSHFASQLAKVPVNEYVRVLQQYQGDELRKIREGLTSYINVDNPTETAIAVMDKAGEALKVIAGQSALNAARANSWGLIQRLDRKYERQIFDANTGKGAA